MEKKDGWHSSKERAVRFLITMNMPAYEGSLVQQITVDIHEAESLKDMCDMMNRDEFIIGHQWYRQKDRYTEDWSWQDRGLVIINTAHIGKVVEFLELGEPRREPPFDKRVGSLRGPIRPGGRNI